MRIRKKEEETRKMNNKYPTASKKEKLNHKRKAPKGGATMGIPNKKISPAIGGAFD